MKTLALFDFDVTLTKKDTLFVFTKYYHGVASFYIGLLVLSPSFLLFALKLIRNDQLKERYLKWFFENESEEQFNTKCECFAETINKIIRPAARDQLRIYLQNEITIAVVSASPINWVKPWCDQYKINCLATALEVVDGRLTGKISGKNCYGDEKVSKIRKHYTLSAYEEIFVYGDSSGDKEMLTLGTKKFYKPFRD